MAATLRLYGARYAIDVITTIFFALFIINFISNELQFICFVYLRLFEMNEGIPNESPVVKELVHVTQEFRLDEIKDMMREDKVNKKLRILSFLLSTIDYYLCR